VFEPNSAIFSKTFGNAGFNRQIRRKSKSDWFIYSRCRNEEGLQHESDDEDQATLLYPHQVISLIGETTTGDLRAILNFTPAPQG
jgi:hypothetical protein